MSRKFSPRNGQSTKDYLAELDQAALYAAYFKASKLAHLAGAAAFYRLPDGVGIRSNEAAEHAAALDDIADELRAQCLEHGDGD